jgi:hypothetical protein
MQHRSGDFDAPDSTAAPSHQAGRPRLLRAGGARYLVSGQRADDTARGGDIDLLIETQITDPEEIVNAEIRFQVQVQQAIGEQKIDLLVDYPGRGEHPPIFAIAERTGVTL